MQKQQAQAIWNQKKDRWETLEPWGVFSETLPKSGMTRNGRLYEREILVPHIGESVSLCSGKGKNLPTPSANDAHRGGSSPDVRKAKKQQVTLNDAAYAMGSKADLLPTPNTMDHREVRTGYQREKQLHRGDFNSPKRKSMGNLREDIVIERESNPVSPYGRYDEAVRRWESVFRPAPYPVDVNSRGNEHLSPRFSEWMMGLPEGWVTSPEIGLTRAQQLKAIGNGVVPQQALAALQVLSSRIGD